MGKKLGARCAVRGGAVVGPHGVDKVPLQATAGEYVLPVATTQAIGVPALNEMVRRTNGSEPGPHIAGGTEHAAFGGELGSNLVDKVAKFFRMGEPTTTRKIPPLQPPPAPSPDLLGTGMAAAAGNAILNRRQQLDAAEAAATGPSSTTAGYANGGEVQSQEGFGAYAGKMVRNAANAVVGGISGANNIAGAIPRFVGGQAVDYTKALFGMPSVAVDTPPGKASTPSTPVNLMQAYSPESLPATVAPSPPTPTTAAQSVVDGAWAPPHGAAPGIGAQLVAGPATTGISSSRDKNGNLVFTNAPFDPNAQPVAPQAPTPARGLGAAMGAVLNQRRAAAQDTQAATVALKAPEMAKNAAELDKLKAQLQLAEAAKDPATRAAILGGYAPATEHVSVPQGYMGDFKSDVPVVTTSGPGAGTIRMVQPQSAPAQLKEGQTGTVKNTKGEMVRVVIRNGVPVPI